GKGPDAEAAFRRALAIQNKLTAEFPSEPQYRQELASSQGNLGHLLSDMGKRLEAEAAYRQALGIEEKLATDFPIVAHYRVDLARSQVNLGQLQRTNEQPEQALQWFAKAIETL